MFISHHKIVYFKNHGHVILIPRYIPYVASSNFAGLCGLICLHVDLDFELFNSVDLKSNKNIFLNTQWNKLNLLGICI